MTNCDHFYVIKGFGAAVYLCLPSNPPKLLFFHFSGAKTTHWDCVVK